MTDLNGQVAVVTGAGRGIGRATALVLARAGARLALVARTVSQLESVAEEVRKLGGTAHVIPADISREEDAERIHRETERVFGQTDILVNNAAAFAGGPVATLSTTDWDRVLNTNLRGTFLVTRAFLPMMIKRQQGAVVMIASTSGKRGDPGGAAYCASKFGLIGFSQSLASEVRQHNIRVVIVAPSAVDTRAVPPDQKPERGKGSRLCAEDVAETVLYTVSLPPRVMVREVELWATNP